MKLFYYGSKFKIKTPKSFFLCGGGGGGGGVCGRVGLVGGGLVDGGCRSK